MVAGCGAISVVVFAVSWLRLGTGLGFAILTAVSLAVAAIPEGLPAVTTIVLALGVQRMAKANALVRRLSAVETLGSADVICTDKTGTLTQNRMTVRRSWAGGRSFDDGSGESAVLGALLRACAHAPGVRVSKSGELEGDPTDLALVVHAQKLGISPGEVLHSLPFDRERRMATVIVGRGDTFSGLAHGAPEAVLECASRQMDESGETRPLTDADRIRLHEVIDEFARSGLRVIALAEKEGPLPAEDGRGALVDAFERDMTLLGFVGIADPPRPEVSVALSRAARAGVRTVMITGDHPLTAEAIGREIGMIQGSAEVATGSELEKLSSEALGERIETIRVVARATAQNKLSLVQALRARGHVVAMTGDGVNDAPAIKAASIGVAMGKGGTDVTREAADMVLLDDNYATIVRAIEEGRIVYSNIKRFIVFLFSANAGLVLAVFVAAALGWPPILTPTQILWINLITNGLPALALGMEPVHLDPMRDPPRSAGATFLSTSEVAWILGYGALMAALGLVVFHFAAEDLVRARTATFTVLAFAPLFHAQSCRSRRESLFRLGIFSNYRLVGALGAALGFQAIALYVPALQGVFQTVALPVGELGFLLGISALILVAGELEKAATRWFASKSEG